ncbi:hypothetical protein SUGI_0689880 [Cryptomeria japonica]|nr:hypothetical protein SUGI_0689880 [Cryptomeria japonica]
MSSSVEAFTFTDERKKNKNAMRRLSVFKFELMTEDELRQIQEGTLSAISFGLDSLTGTSNMSAGKCDLGSDSAVGDKGKVVYKNIQNIPPLPKTYIKNPAKLKRKRGDEDPSEPSSAAKRIDFDDPSAT